MELSMRHILCAPVPLPKRPLEIPHVHPLQSRQDHLQSPLQTTSVSSFQITSPTSSHTEPYSIPSPHRHQVSIDLTQQMLPNSRKTSLSSTVSRALIQIRSPEIAKHRKCDRRTNVDSATNVKTSLRYDYWNTVLNGDDTIYTDEFKITIVRHAPTKCLFIQNEELGPSITQVSRKQDDFAIEQAEAERSSIDRPFLCSHCGTSFRKKSNLVKHIALVELKLRPYKCEICDAKFGQKSNLTTHIRVRHNGDRPHMCPEDGCDRRFSQRGGLRAHVDTVHKKQRRFVCECGTAFGHRGDLNRKFAAIQSLHISTLKHFLF